MVNGEDVTECPRCGTALDGNARHTKGPPFLIHEPKVCRDVLADEVLRLRALIHRDRTGLAEAIERMVKEAGGRLWVTEGRGPYAWDDERYKDEAGIALRAVMAIGKAALGASGDNADSAFRPDAPKVVMWGGRKMKRGRCDPDRQCLACDRLGEHLEPSE